MFTIDMYVATKKWETDSMHAWKYIIPLRKEALRDS